MTKSTTSRNPSMTGFAAVSELVQEFLDYMAGPIEPVKLHYLWRPQLSDVADEMVLETAIDEGDRLP